MDMNKTTKKDLFMVDPRNIVIMDGFNSRRNFDIDSLCESIKENGIRNPLTCMAFTDENGEKKYKLVDGERRYRATMKAISDGAEIARVPVVCISNKTSEQELLLEQLLRNDGKRFNEYEMGIACQKFLNWGWTKAEITTKLAFSNPAYVTMYTQHLDRDPRVQELLKNDKITGSEVRTIYQQHRNPDTNELDEDGAVKDILLGAKKSELKGKKRITIKDFDKGSKTRVNLDTKKIKTGLNLLINYYKEATKDGSNVELNIIDLINQLNDGKMITDILSGAKDVA